MTNISKQIPSSFLFLLKILYVSIFILSLFLTQELDFADYRDTFLSTKKIRTILLMLIQGGLLYLIMRPLLVQAVLIGSALLLFIPTKEAGFLILILLMAMYHVFEILAFFVFLTQQRFKTSSEDAQKIGFYTNSITYSIQKPFNYLKKPLKLGFKILLFPLSCLKINNLADFVYLLSLIACIVWPHYLSETHIRLKEVVVITFALSVVQAISLNLVTRSVLIPAALLFLGVLNIVWNVPTWEYNVYHKHFEAITYYNIDFMLSNNEDSIKLFIKYPILQTLGFFLFVWKKYRTSKYPTSIRLPYPVPMWIKSLYIVTFLVSVFYFNGATQTSLSAMWLGIVEAFFLLITRQTVLLPFSLFTLSFVNIFLFLYPAQTVERIPGFCVEALKILPTYQAAEVVGFFLFLYTCWLQWKGKSKFFNLIKHYLTLLSQPTFTDDNNSSNIIPVSNIKIWATAAYICTVILSIALCFTIPPSSHFYNTNPYIIHKWALFVQIGLLFIITPKYFAFITALITLLFNGYALLGELFEIGIYGQYNSLYYFIKTKPVLEIIGLCIFAFNKWGVSKWPWAQKLYTRLTPKKLGWLWLTALSSVCPLGLFISIPLVGFITLKGWARISAIMLPPLFINLILMATTEGMGVLLIVLGSIPYAIVCGILAKIGSILEKRKEP